MINRMLNGTPRRLEAILSSFTQVIDELQRLATYNRSIVAANEEKMKLVIARNNVLKSEADQAEAVSSKINILIS